MLQTEPAAQSPALSQIVLPRRQKGGVSSTLVVAAGSAVGGAYEPAACRSASIGVGGASVAKASSAASLSSPKSASRPCYG